MAIFVIPDMMEAEGARDGSVLIIVFLVSPATFDDALELLNVAAGSVGFCRYAISHGVRFMAHVDRWILSIPSRDLPFS